MTLKNINIIEKNNTIIICNKYNKETKIKVQNIRHYNGTRACIFAPIHMCVCACV